MTSFDLSLLAYLDPMAGALILQVIAAFLLGAGVMLRRFIFAPFRLLSRRTRAKVTNIEGQSQEQP